MILFLGSYFTDNIYKQIISDSKGSIANANNLLQLNLITGFRENLPDGVFGSLSMPQIGSYPNLYKKRSFIGDGVEYLSFLNIKGIKHYSQQKNLRKYLLNILKSYDNIHFVVYDIHIPFLSSLNSLKKEYKFTVTLIVPDLIGYTGERNNIFLKVWQQYRKKKLNGLLSLIDGFVFLTESMNDKINIFKKPYQIIEGIYDTNMYLEISTCENQYGTYIFYAGALDDRNGIKNLIDSFCLLKNNDLKLVLCGTGVLQNYIQEINNPNIICLGQQDRSLINILEQNAFLLINPRPTEETFTKYSFPSKTMEFFASGKPVLMYRLSGVPAEYFDFCFELKGHDSHSLSKELEFIINYINQNPQLTKSRFSLARDFIINHKNPKVQVSKIIELLEQYENTSN